MGSYHLLKYGLAVVLAFVGLKMVWLNDVFDGAFLITWSLAFIVFVVAGSIAASLAFPNREAGGARRGSSGPVEASERSRASGRATRPFQQRSDQRRIPRLPGVELRPVLLSPLVILLSTAAAAQELGAIDFENGAAAAGYDDVRIPGSGGTLLSLTDTAVHYASVGAILRF